MCSSQHDAADLSGFMGANGYAAHTGDAGLLVHFGGIDLIYGLHGAFFGAQAAFHAVSGGLGYHTGAAAFVIRTMPWNLQLGTIAMFQLLVNLLGKLAQLCLVLLVRAPCRKLAHDGMLCHSGNAGDHMEPCLLCRIL